MHKKVFMILGVVFLGVGILLGIAAAGVYAFGGSNHRRIAADAVPVTAVIWDIERWQVNRAYIRYEVDGAEFIAPLSWYSDNMFVGQPIEILVNPQNPHEFTNTWGLYLIAVWILSGLAGIFGGLGLIFLIVDRRRRRRQQWLFEYGTAVWANVVGTEANWSIQVNGRPAMVLVATYGNMRFVSGPLDNNDLANIGDHVKVLLHPDDNNKYAFDFKNESHRNPKEPPSR